MRKSDKTIQEQESIIAEYLLGILPIMSWGSNMELTLESSTIEYQYLTESQ